MRHTLLALLSVIGIAAVLALAQPGGPEGHVSLAHMITPTGTPGPPVFHVEIDADALNGNGPCDPFDTTADVTGRHEVAVCITDAPAPVAAFNFELVYDDTLNRAPEIDFQGGPALDANPDANLGATLGSGLPTRPGLGGGWDCSAMALAPPRGDTDPETGPGHGVAFITCYSPTGPYTSPVGAAPWPLAVVTFDMLAPGIDTLTLRNVALYDVDGTSLGYCNNSYWGTDIPCYEASNAMTFDTPTPTDTATPCVVGGQPCTPTPTNTFTPTPTPTFTPTITLTPTITPTPRDTATPWTPGPGSGTFHLAIDADATNGNGPCNPVDATADVTGGAHEVAVCIESAPEPIGYFQFFLVYDDTLNRAPEIDFQGGPALDANPDANGGVTLGSGVTTRPDLGSGWDCTSGACAPPRGDTDPETGPGHGVAYLGCLSATGPFTSPVNADYWPLAVVTFNVLASGTDTLTLQDVWVGDQDANLLGSCNPDNGNPIDCYGASIIKTYVTATPTDTPLPTATAAPTDTPLPTDTPTPEPWSGVCVAGFWDVNYDGSAMGNCEESLDQAGATALSGGESCTHAALGSVSGSLDQSTLVATSVIQFQQPAYTVAVSATYSPDGDSASGTWTCTAGCVGASGTFTGNRINDHYATPVPASSGGELTTALNDTLVVPPGALPSDQDITIDISTLPVAPPEDLTPLTRAYTFGPAGLQFLTPVTVTFRYTDSDLAGGSIDPATLRVYVYDPDIGTWELVGGSVDTVAKTVTVQLDHFSTYSIFGEEPPTPTPTFTPSSTLTPTYTPTPTNTHTPGPTPTSTRTPKPGAVGGVAEPPDMNAWPPKPAGSSVPNAVTLAGVAAGALTLLAAGAWHARRRWRAR